MNIVYLSPHFPPQYFRFCQQLNASGATVLGIGDAAFDTLKPEVRSTLTEYYRVDDMHDYDALVRACGFFTHKYGKIDRFESLNEYWLSTEARIRDDFNIFGVRACDIDDVRRKSHMKEVFRHAGVPVARGRRIASFAPHLGRDMELKVYGHWGMPIIVFPSSRGRFFDYEGMGMIDAISHTVEAGKVKLFSVDSVDAESWYNFDVSPQERNDRHEAYDHYITEEVVPFIRSHCGSSDQRVMTNGCSMGAYHAVNFFFKHPDVFEGVIALSGLYRLDRYEFGLSAADLPAVYYNSPVSYFEPS